MEVSTTAERKRKFRDLIHGLYSVEEDDKETRLTQTRHAFDTVGSIYDGDNANLYARYPIEVCIGSKVIRTACKQMLNITRNIKGNMYDKHALAAHFRNFPRYWNFYYPREVLLTKFMFGCLVTRPMVEASKLPRKKVVRQKAAAVTKPLQISSLEHTDKGNEMIVKVRDFISQKFAESSEPISYFHLVLDPNSFTRTVENMYYMSFLVRDGAVKIKLDANTNLPFIMSCKGTSPDVIEIDNEDDEQEDEDLQFILSINKEKWTKLIDLFQLNAP